MRVALDSNILLYAEGIDDEARRLTAVDIIGRLPPENVVLPVQAVGELFNVLVRRGARTRSEAKRVCDGWTASYEVVDTTAEIMMHAVEFSADHAFSIWDAVILHTAAFAGCHVLLSEDMQHGFAWNGVTIVNPFLDDMHPRLAGLLDP